MLDPIKKRTLVPIPIEASRSHKVHRTTGKSLLIVAGMFAFAFALVPLYDIFCEVTGLNGKSSRLVSRSFEQIDKPQIDANRQLTIQFLATSNKNMAWKFASKQAEMTIHPGEIYTTSYYAENPTNHPMRAQAVPSVSPVQAASYLRKVECFCFESQFLAAGDSMDMPVRFYVHQALPADINTITLSYTMFDITQGEELKMNHN